MAWYVGRAAEQPKPYTQRDAVAWDGIWVVEETSTSVGRLQTFKSDVVIWYVGWAV